MAERKRLRVDPIACDGVGICAHLAADLVRIDSWGYPIVADNQLQDQTRRQAGAAVAACPHRALFIDSLQPTHPRVNTLGQDGPQHVGGK